jgi:hypothetical protein
MAAGGSAWLDKGRGEMEIVAGIASIVGAGILIASIRRYL